MSVTTSLKDECRELCLSPIGVDLFGVAPVERFADQPQGHRPETFLAGAKSVVVLGSQLFRVLTDQLSVKRGVGEFSFRDICDAHSEAVINDLRQSAYRLARFLTNRGFASINLDQKLTDGRTLTGAFSFKGAAVAAGLGAIGKNSLLLTPSYGPRLRLAVVITQAEIEADPMLPQGICGNCRVCIQVCPSAALKDPEPGQAWNHDRFVCVNYNSASKGCGLCVARCPR